MPRLIGWHLGAGAARRVGRRVRHILLHALLLAAPLAQADGWSGAIGLSSDQVLRGVSQSQGQAGLTLDASHRSDTGWALGLGASTLGRDGAGRPSLLTASLGRHWQLDADWAAQLGAAHYAYPGPLQRRRYGYDELLATVGWQGRLAASLAVSPNTTRPNTARRAAPQPGAPAPFSQGRALAWELSLHQRLQGRLALDAGLGYFDLHALRGQPAAGYPYASVALGWGVGPVQGFVSVIGSRAAQRRLAQAGAAGERGLLSVVWDF